MRFFSIFLSIFLACTGVWAVPGKHGPPVINVDGKDLVVSHDVANVVKSFEHLDKQICSFSAVLTKFRSNQMEVKVIYRLIEIGVVSGKLKGAMNKAIKTLQKVKRFNKAESEIIMKVMVRSAPHSQDMLDNLKARKPDFDTAVLHSGSISHTIARSLRRTQKKVELLQDVVMSKLSSEYEPMGPAISAHIKKQYDELVTYFEKSGGKFEVPDVIAFKDFVGDRIKEVFNKMAEHYIMCEMKYGKKVYCIDHRSKRKYEKFMKEHPEKKREEMVYVNHKDKAAMDSIVVSK